MISFIIYMYTSHVAVNFILNLQLHFVRHVSICYNVVKEKQEEEEEEEEEESPDLDKLIMYVVFYPSWLFIPGSLSDGSFCFLMNGSVIPQL